MEFIGVILPAGRPSARISCPARQDRPARGSQQGQPTGAPQQYIRANVEPADHERVQRAASHRTAETEGGGAICDEGQAGRLTWVSGQVEKV